MRQIIRRVIDRKGKVVVADYPEPHLGAGQVLVQNHYSLISSGTEMSTLAKTPAELVKQTLSDPWMRHVVQQTIFSTGVVQTARRVWQELLLPREIGYSGAGRVLEVGDGVEGFKVGDPVAYAATGHAEIVAPSVNHIVPVADDVDLRHAAFVTVGGIAVQALRRAEIRFGEVVAVYGLGLVGQICARLAKSAGCVVVGIDISEARNRLARESGADLVIDPTKSDLERRILDFTGKHGVDATVICASSKSSEIINNSMKITRRQGRVAIVGYVNLEIHPKEFLYREIDLRYSRAYGPGSYHRAYEKGRVDYPFGYVRWTEKRNLAEFVRQIRNRTIDLEPLIGGTFRVDDVQEAFDAIARGRLSSVAALIDYQGDRPPDRRRTLEVRSRLRKTGRLGMGVVGCGNHFLVQHLPNLRSLSGVEIRGIASATGKRAAMVAETAGATLITTDLEELLADEETDAVMVCSSQPEHAVHIRQVVEAGKALFVEKPMVTRLEDFREIDLLMRERPVLFTLGLNRRYSPLVGKLREAFEGPVDAVNYTISQPFVPPDHWTLDEVDGGGRLITEGEHFLDLCHLLIGRPPLSISARALGEEPDDLRRLCSFAVSVHYDGAVAQIVFSESGSVGHPRERITVLGRGQVAMLDDFAKLTVHSRKQRIYRSGLRKEMGHRQELKQFVQAVRGEPHEMLDWEDARLATLSMFAAQESLRRGETIDLRRFNEDLEQEAVPGGEDAGS